MVDDKQAWQETDLGLAIFLNSDSLQCWRVAEAFPEQVFVSQRFFVRPMLPMLGANSPFVILSLSKNKVALYEASGATINELDVPGLPNNLNEALSVTHVDRGAQGHTGAREVGGKQGRVFHGQDVKHESAETDLLQYFKQVNAAVTEFLGDDDRPMVLACIADHAPKYRGLNTFSDLLAGTATGNFDRQTNSQLLEKAKPFVTEYFEAQRRAATKVYHDVANTIRSVSETRDLLAAAHNGQIDKLFVNESASLPGEFDVAKQTIVCENQADGFDRDLVEDAIAQTVLHRGEVFALADDEMPTDQPIVATLRY